MKVIPLEVDESHRKIFEDPELEVIVEAVVRHQRLLAFIAMVLRDYRTHSDLTARKPSLRRSARSYGRGRTEKGAVDRICTAVERLYNTFDPSSVRGVLLEALVERTIGSRYADHDDTLTNNLKFKVEQGSKSHETSTSIDVIGVDSSENAGECHDCKVASKNFDAEWIEELTTKVAPFGFRIGVTTADSADRAHRALRKAGIKAKGTPTVVTSDAWWDVLPLRP